MTQSNRCPRCGREPLFSCRNGLCTPAPAPSRDEVLKAKVQCGDKLSPEQELDYLGAKEPAAGILRPLTYDELVTEGRWLSGEWSRLKDAYDALKFEMLNLLGSRNLEIEKLKADNERLENLVVDIDRDGEFMDLQARLNEARVELSEAKHNVIHAESALNSIINSYGYKLTPDLAYELANDYFKQCKGTREDEWDALEKERDEWVAKYRNIETANKELTRNDHVNFGKLMQERDRYKAALEYQLVALRKLRDGSMFTPESEIAAAEKRIREALEAGEKTD